MQENSKPKGDSLSSQPDEAGADQGRKRKAPKAWSDYETSNNYSCGQSSISKPVPKKVQKKKVPEEAPKPQAKVQTRALDPVATAPPPSAKQISAKQLAAKLQALDEAEEEIIQEHLNRDQAKQPRQQLPEGPQNVGNMMLALVKSMQETTSLITDWSSPACRVLGSTCKVYWDGELQWFYARILNYDSFYDRYYVSPALAPFSL